MVLGGDDGENAIDSEPFTIEHSTEVLREMVPASPSSFPAPASPAGGHPGPVEEREFSEEDLDAEHDDAPLRLRAINDIIGDAAPPALARRVLDAELNFTSADEPASFREAEEEESWRQAMSEETKAIEDNGTWELTILLAGHREIGLKWVYKVKRNEAGNIVRHKAHLVAKGYVQRVSIDFNEVFAPVVCLESMRMLVPLTAHER
jgi:hypothetical protein